MKVKKEIVILNRLGLHARPASKFAQAASTFQSQIWLMKEDQMVDGKSILEVLTVSCPSGTSLTLIAEGPDAQEAVDALSELVASRFGGMD